MVKHRDRATGMAQMPADGCAASPAPASSSLLADGAAGATPVMAQYLEIKTANPDSLLWYRMGDFYELFFEDAVVASEALSIVLTKRGQHQGKAIPMCGVPVHRADEYLQRLIKKGFRVAVCEQLEDPAEARKRGAKAVVKRDVVRLVTPGTITEDALLEAKARNYLTALFARPEDLARRAGLETAIAIASVDISTGEFELGELMLADLAGELVRLSPSEIICGDALLADGTVKRAVQLSGGVATPVPEAYFDSQAGSRDLKAQLGVRELDGFGSFSRSALAATGAVLRYIALTQMGQRPHLRPPRRMGHGAGLIIDAGSRASLELVTALSGGASTTLFAAMDRTVSGAGGRELMARVTSPLADGAEINARLDAVAHVLANRRYADIGSSPVSRSLHRTMSQHGVPDRTDRRPFSSWTGRNRTGKIFLRD